MTLRPELAQRRGTLITVLGWVLVGLLIIGGFALAFTFGPLLLVLAPVIAAVVLLLSRNRRVAATAGAGRNPTMVQGRPSVAVERFNPTAVWGLACAFYIPPIGLPLSIFSYRQCKALHLRGAKLALTGICVSSAGMLVIGGVVVNHVFF